VFTARYALSPYIKQISFVFKGLTKYLVLEMLLKGLGCTRYRPTQGQQQSACETSRSVGPTSVIKSNTGFWGVALCNVIAVYRCFGLNIDGVFRVEEWSGECILP
jgi:hypothetical protein